MKIWSNGQAVFEMTIKNSIQYLKSKDKFLSAPKGTSPIEEGDAQGSLNVKKRPTSIQKQDEYGCV